MSPKCYKKARWLIFLFIGFATSASSQNVIISTTGTCSNTSDGSISMELDSALLDNYPLPYAAEWENITDGEYGTFYFTSLSHTIPDLTAGDYELIIALDGQCEIHLDATVESLTAPELSIIPTCICPGGYGALNVVVTGGSGNYSYYWDGPSPINPLEQNLQVAEQGTYSVTVIDNDTGCEATAEATVEECNFDISNFTVTTTNVCTDPNSGSITIQIPPESGQAPYWFFWFKEDEPYNQTIHVSNDGYDIAENLSAGEYCVNILSNNGCMAQACNLVIEEYISSTISYTIFPETEPGNNDGGIDLSLQGGTGPFSFLWDDPASTSEDLSNLSAGTYCVTITYGSGCTVEECITIEECAALEVLFAPYLESYAVVSPAGAYIDLTIPNTEGYLFNFLWNDPNASTTEDIYNLTPGDYCVDISHNACLGVEDHLCAKVCDFTVWFERTKQCDGIWFTANIDPPSAATFLWDNGETSQTAFVAYGGDLCVTVTSGVCSAKACVKAELIPVKATSTVTNSTFGNDNGSMTVTAQQGIPPYNYQWSHDPNETAATATNLSPGQYCVTVTDACENTETICDIVECEFGPNQINANVTPVQCQQGVWGAIDLTPNVSIPEPAFTYQWSNGETSEDISNLKSGEYSVTITEGTTGCYAVLDFTVPLIGVGNFPVNLATESGCLGGQQGQITAIPNGGEEPHSYMWYYMDWSVWGSVPVGATQTISNLQGGWYFVYVTDNMGCTVSKGTILWEQPTFTITPAISDNPVCFGETADVSLQVIDNTGNPVPIQGCTWVNQSISPYTPIQTSIPELLGLEPGTWTVTVTNNEGCKAATWFKISENSKIEVEVGIQNICIPSVGSIYPGELMIENISGGTPAYSYQWCCGGTSNGGTYSNLTEEGMYSLTVTDAIGCTSTNSFEVREVTIATVSGTVTNANCTCCATGGAIHLSIENVTPPFYLIHYEETPSGIVPVEWLGEFLNTELTFINLKVGIEHYFLVTYSENKLDCNSIFHDPLVIEPDNPLEITIENVSPISGYIDISVSGGLGPYTFLWSNNETSEDIFSVGPGVFTVTVTDAQQCTAIESIEICEGSTTMGYTLPYSYPAGFVTPCITGKDVGAIKPPIPNVGTEPYTYEWSGPGSFTLNPSTGEITGLTVPGEYCVTVTDACYRSFSHCQEIKCDCELDVTPFFIDDCTRSDPGSIELDKIAPFTDHEYLIRWPDNDLARVHVDNNFSIDQVIFGVKKKEFPTGFSGPACMEVIDAEWGCNVNHCVDFFSLHDCLYFFERPNNFNANDNALINALNSTFPVYEENFVARCARVDPCENTSDDFLGTKLLKYYPTSSIEPCKAGGEVRCTGCGIVGDGSFTFIIPPNFVGYELEVGGDNCYCVWPPGLVYDDAFYEFAGKTASLLDKYPFWSPFGEIQIPMDIYSAAIVAEVDCNVYVPPGGGGGGVPVGPNCDALGNPCGEGEECIFVAVTEQCMYNVFCPNSLPGSEPVATLPGIRSLCVTEIENTCVINLQCSLNSCDNIMVAWSLHNDPFLGNYMYWDELISGIGALDEELSIIVEIELADLIENNCGGDGICTCEEISENLNQCFQCNGDGFGEWEPQGKKSITQSPNSKPPYAFEESNEGFLVRTFPNPFSNELNIEIITNDPKETKIVISNLLGEKIWMENQYLTSGTNLIRWSPHSDLPSGLYQLLVIDEDGRKATKKVVFAN